MNSCVIWLFLLSIGMKVNSLDALNTFEWTSDGQWHKSSTGLNVNPYLPSRSTCIDLPSNLSLCHGIGYNKMRLPNLLQHETLQEVIEQSASWVPLARLSCHPDTGLFLCSLFAPVCLDHPIPPCRSLCTTVQSACERQMAIYGYPWPELVKCDQFPLDNDMCITAQHARGGIIGASSSSSSSSGDQTTETRVTSESPPMTRERETEQTTTRKESDLSEESKHKTHHHMHTLAEIAEESRHNQEEDEKHHHHHIDTTGLSVPSNVPSTNVLLASYCRSQWSLRTKASFRGYTNDLIHGRLRSYKVIHGSGTFKGRQHAQLWADTNFTMLWPRELTWRQLLHPTTTNTNVRYFIMGYTTQGRNKATLIAEWPASADHSFRRSLRIIKSGSIDCTGESATSESYFHGNSDA